MKVMYFQKTTTQYATRQQLLDEYRYVNVEHGYWFDWIQDSFYLTMEKLEFYGDPKDMLEVVESYHNHFRTSIKAGSSSWDIEDLQMLIDNLKAGESDGPFEQTIIDEYVNVLETEVLPLMTDGCELTVSLTRTFRNNTEVQIELQDKDGEWMEDETYKMEVIFDNFFKYFMDKVNQLVNDDFDFLIEDEQVWETLELNNYFGWEVVEGGK